MISVLLHVQFAGQTSERDEVRSKCVECMVLSVLGLACCTVTVDPVYVYILLAIIMLKFYIYFNKSCTVVYHLLGDLAVLAGI